MAVPTITTITPNLVWTGGQGISIFGTNFKLPTTPGPSTGPLPSPLPTVRVTFDGIAAARVDVMGNDELFVMAPEHDEGPVTVVVYNLDGSAVPIPGESVSLVGGVTYARPELSQDADITRVHVELVKTMKRQIIDNVLTFIDVDFGESPYEITALGELPALVLSGPNVLSWTVNPQSWIPIFTGGYPSTEFKKLRPAVIVDLEYEISGFTDNSRQLINLQTALAQFLDRNVRLKVQRDPANAAAGYVYCDIEVPFSTISRATTEPNKNNLRSFQMSFAVRNVPIESIAGFANENLAGVGGVAETFTINSSKLVV